MFKKITILFAVIVTVVSLVGCQTSSKENEKMVVYTTLFPLYDFVKEIGQDKVEVHLLLPNQADGHGYEPSAQDIVKIQEADLFIYTSDEMEPWVAGLLPEFKGKVEVVNASTNVNWLSFEEETHGEGEEEHEDDHSGNDPHVWMDLENASKMVQTISDTIQKIDAQNAELYQTNTLAYQAKLMNLDDQFKTMIDQAKHKEIVFAGHFALGYLTHRYSLSYIAAYKSGGELTPTVLASMIDALKQGNINTIFHEENIEPTIAKSIAKETGANLLMLHGLHNVSKQELEQGVTFLTLMEQNFKNLEVGLNDTP